MSEEKERREERIIRIKQKNNKAKKINNIFKYILDEIDDIHKKLGHIGSNVNSLYSIIEEHTKHEKLL